MLVTARRLILPACAVLLVGCGATASDGTGTTPPTTASSTPAATTPPLSEPSTVTSVSTPDAVTVTSTEPGPTSVVPSTPDPASSTSAAPPSTPVDAGEVPADVMVPDQGWAPVSGERVEDSAVAAWLLPQTCAIDAPATATAMRTATIGTGEFEAPVGVQQVAVFADADSAVTEADRLAVALARCSTVASEGGTQYTVEPLPVGAQGLGLAQDYYGAGGDDALGSYLTVTRRGSAVTLVAHDGGESTVGVARTEVTDQAQAAWELLCRYDSAGC